MENKKKKLYKFMSLLLVFLMLAAATITVKKEIFGYKGESTAAETATLTHQTDTIAILPDGDVVIHTSGMPGTVSGYAGPVPLDITISKGKITAITPPANSETPSFFGRATTLFSNWIGKTPEEASTMKVDAVSGATYSSEAIISNVSAGVNHYLGTKKDAGPSMPWKLWVAFGVTLAACILPLFVRNKIYHNVQLVANIIVLGFWCGQFLDHSLILKYMSEGFAFPAALTAIAMLAAAFIYPLFGHPQHYCTHICPLGSAQQIMGEIYGYKIHLSTKLVKWLDWFRKILWAVLMILLWADALTGWMDLELFQAFQYESASIGILIAAGAFLLLSLIVTRPYCRFVCPTGSLFKRSENLD